MAKMWVHQYPSLDLQPNFVRRSQQVGNTDAHLSLADFAMSHSDGAACAPPSLLAAAATASAELCLGLSAGGTSAARAGSALATSAAWAAAASCAGSLEAALLLESCSGFFRPVRTSLVFKMFLQACTKLAFT